MEIRCDHCGKLIDPKRLDWMYRKVVGWERHRDQGGTNAVAAREPQDVWMHPSCMDEHKRGIAPGQGSLI